MFGLTSGHADLSDTLLLVAFIIFVVEAVLYFLDTKVPRLSLVAIGLALLSLAFYVL